MALKRRVSYQWKFFLPPIVGLWVVIIGTLFWHIDRVRAVRDEMVFDQLSVMGSRIVELYEKDDAASVEAFSEFLNEFYADSENYDPLNIWITDVKNDSVVKRVGSDIRSTFTLPKNKQGIIEIPIDQLDDNFSLDTRFIYSVHASPSTKKRVYLMLPYTKRLRDVVSSRTTIYCIIYIVLGLLITIITYVSGAYFGRSLRLLKNFATKASSDPNFVLTDEVEFPHNELGDISGEIVNIYNQRAIEMNKREKEHKVALSAVEEKERIKRELTGNINHELKTPVGVIQGYIDTIVENKDMDEATRNRFLEKVQLSVHRLTDLINDITAITRLESGSKLVNVEVINFRNFCFSLSNMIDESGVLMGKMSFSYDVPGNCMILGNVSLLNTVFLNFVKNSVAYSEGTICRLIYTKQDEEFYYFTYYDNGIGVPPQHLPHMFERFYRVNAGRSRHTGGTGLGLAIVKVTIQSLGGKITVSNHFPTGLEFNFSLPKAKQKDIDAYDSHINEISDKPESAR